MHEDSDYMAQIIRMFKAHNCHEETLLTKEQLTHILNQQANDTIRRDFNMQIVREIWGQAETNSRGQSTMRTFAKILNNAIDILESRLYRINSEDVGIPHYRSELTRINDQLIYLESEYEAGFLQNYEKINVERKNKVIIENKIKELKEQELTFKKELEEIKACIYPIAQPPPPVSARETRVEKKQVVRQDPQISYSFDRTANPTLLLLFQLCVVGVILQLLVLTIKPNFLALICYFLVVFWLFLGYYDKNFLTYILIGFGLSLLMDLIYLLLQFTASINTVNPTGSGLVVLIVIFLILELALRVLIMIKMLPFRKPTQKEEFFVVGGVEVELKHRAGKRDSIRY